MAKNNITEALVQKEIEEFLVRAGFVVIRINGGRKGYLPFYRIVNTGKYKGISDLIAVKKDRSLFVEAKRSKGGIQSDEQKDFQQLCESKGLEYILGNSLDAVINHLKRGKNGTDGLSNGRGSNP